MSNDPGQPPDPYYGQQPPPGYYPPPGQQPPPDGGYPPHGYTYPPPPVSPSERVKLPAYLLLGVGAFNLLLSLVFVFQLVQAILLTPEQAQEQVDAAAQMMQGFGLQPPPQTAQDVKRQAVIQSVVGSSLALLGGMLTTLGAWRMLKLRSYGLAVLGAALACIPCVSCTGCFGLGQIAGIWAIIVLLDPTVKLAFQANVQPPSSGQAPWPTL